MITQVLAETMEDGVKIKTIDETTYEKIALNIEIELNGKGLYTNQPRFVNDSSFAIGKRSESTRLLYSQIQKLISFDKTAVSNLKNAPPDKISNFNKKSNDLPFWVRTQKLMKLRNANDQPQDDEISNGARFKK